MYLNIFHDGRILKSEGDEAVLTLSLYPDSLSLECNEPSRTAVLYRGMQNKIHSNGCVFYSVEEFIGLGE